MEPKKRIDWRETARTTAAVQDLIRISQNLMALGERETQALLQGDMLGFGFLQDEKDKLVGQYTKASEEFRARLDDFRNVEKSLISRLESLQKSLADKTHSNNVMILQMQQRSESNVHKTLLVAQEYGQHKRSRFENNHATDDKQRGAQ